MWSRSATWRPPPAATACWPRSASCSATSSPTTRRCGRTSGSRGAGRSRVVGPNHPRVAFGIADGEVTRAVFGVERLADHLGTRGSRALEQLVRAGNPDVAPPEPRSPSVDLVVLALAADHHHRVAEPQLGV